MNRYEQGIVDRVAAQLARGARVHEFFLRDDFMVQLLLPASITAAEAERLTSFVDQVAIQAAYQTAGLTIKFKGNA